MLRLGDLSMPNKLDCTLDCKSIQSHFVKPVRLHSMAAWAMKMWAETFSSRQLKHIGLNILRLEIILRRKIYSPSNWSEPSDFPYRATSYFMIRSYLFGKGSVVITYRCQTMSRKKPRWRRSRVKSTLPFARKTGELSLKYRVLPWWSNLLE